MTYREKREKYKPALISTGCWNGGHKACQGYRMSDGRRGTKLACQCYCHVHICPRCKQPSKEAVKGKLLNAAAQLENMAKTMRNGAGVNG